MDIKKAGWRFFSIQRNEFGFTIPLFFLYFLSGAFFATGQIISETIFLKTYGAQGLSSFFMYNGVAIIALGILYNLFILKITLQKGYIILISLFTLLISCASLIPDDKTGCLPFALYMGNYLFTFFLDLHFFNYIFQYLTIRNSKRILPFLMGGGKLGGIIASLAVYALYMRPSGNVSLYLWALCGASMIIPLLVLRRDSYRFKTSDSGKSLELLPDIRFIEKIIRKIRISYSSPIFTYSLIVIFIMSVVNQISEFYFSSIFNNIFKTHNELAAFLSAYTFVGDMLTLLLQLFFMSRFIKRTGVQGANYIYPVSFFSFILLTLIYPSLIAGIALRFFRKNLSLLFRTPIFNFIMSSAPRDRMAEVKSFLNGIVSPAGMIAGGACIMLLYRRLPSVAGYALTLSLGLLFIIFTYYQNSAYMRSLRNRLDFFLPPENGLPDDISVEMLISDKDNISRNLSIIETFFNANPSLVILNSIYPHFRMLTTETKENILHILLADRSKHADEILAQALNDPVPGVRALALSIVKTYSYEAMEKILKEHFRPALKSEFDAVKLLLYKNGKSGTEDIDIDAFALASIIEISSGIVTGKYDPVEFIIISRALPAAYYTPQLLRLVLVTRNLTLLKDMILHSDTLTRQQARRIIYYFRNAPFEYLINFLALCRKTAALESLMVLNSGRIIPQEKMTELFQFDEKSKGIILSRLFKDKSYQNKFNYLNYTLCLDIKPETEINEFIQYETDIILYLKRLRDYLRGIELPLSSRNSTLLKFILISFEDIIELHKHLVLKAFAIITGIDIKEIYESNIFLKDKDLNSYLLEYIENSGKIAKRALIILDDDNIRQYPDDDAAAGDHMDVLWASPHKTKNFLPTLNPAMNFCIRHIVREINSVHDRRNRYNYNTEEEMAMYSLLEKILFLKESTFFSGLTINELFHIARITRELEIQKNKKILTEGEIGDELFIIAEGEVEIYTRGKVLERLGRGNCVGELSIIDTEPRSASARAITKTRILLIKRADFLLTLKENPAISINIMQVITHRLRRMIASAI